MAQPSTKAEEIAEAKEENKFETLSNNLQYYKTLDKGWVWIVLLACFGTFFIIGANMYGVGIVHGVLLERYNESISLTAWAGSLHTAFVSVGAPLSTIAVDRFSCRTAVMLSGLLITAGYLGTAFAPNIQTAIFTLGIVAGSGAGLGYTSSIVVIAFNFQKRRDIALGLALSGMGAGLFALAPAMQIAHDYNGNTGFLVIQAAISLHILVFGAAYFPSKFELYVQESHNCNNLSDTSSLKSTQRFIEVTKQFLKALHNIPIFLLCIGMFLNCVGIYILYLHLPVYTVSKGFSKTQASYMMSLTGILAVIGRLLTGLAASLNKSLDIWLYSGSFAVVAVATLVFPHVSHTLRGNICYAVVLGFFFGSCYVLMTSVDMAFVDMRHVSAAIGVELFFGGIGAILGPELAAIAIDYGGSYDQSITFAGGCLMLASVSSILTVCFHEDSKSNKKKYTWRFQIRRKT